MEQLAFPADDERHFICGKTGTGKSVFGLWTLSLRSYHEMAWIVIDSKLDPTIAEIRRAIEIGPGDRIPKRPGLYVVRPGIGQLQDGTMTEWLMKVWTRGDTGLFFDEGYAFKPNDRGVLAIMTQGRSKRIPVIALAQRPVNVSKTFMSEAEYYSVFHMHTPSDLDTIGDWLPRRDDDGNRVSPEALEDHECYWYGSKQRQLVRLAPCPPPDVVLDTFDKRIPRRFSL